MFKLLSALILSASLLGCSATSERPDTTRLVVQYATLKAIESGSSPSRIVEVGNRVLEAAQGESVTLAALEAAAAREIAHLALSDRLVAEALIELVVAEINARIDGGVLDAEALTTVTQVIGWAVQAARLAG